MKTPAICYQITPLDPHAHLFEVRLALDHPAPQQSFALPAWIPGSYMIRDFARHIVSLRAECVGRAVALTQRDKHTWQITGKVRGPLLLIAQIYAWDLSVRGAHLDATHGFFNATSLCLKVCGREHEPCIVQIDPPAGAQYQAWRLATTLPPLRVGKNGFGRYRAANYDELIDHPVEMGTFKSAQFSACGVPHEIVITGRHDCDLERLCSDLKKICEWHIRLFGEPAPFERYLFLITAVGQGYGGLEHRSSTALLCSRDDLPGPNMGEPSEAYRGFLGLCSHEYFHAWNVKRIQPAALQPCDLSRENYTTLLWAFEGFTSYYDDLALVRTGLITPRQYLDLLQKNITNLQRTPGRFKQSVAQASFNAWTHYYRQDENTPNARVSYYLKGGLIALLLDCTLRAQSRVSLDDVMRALWQRFGQSGQGVGEDDIRLIAEEISGLDLKRLFEDAVRGTRELPLAAALAQMGVRLQWQSAQKTPSLGIKLAAEGEARVVAVFQGGAAQRAGLSAEDVIIAQDGIKVSARTLESRLARHAPGDVVVIHAFRRDELMQFQVTLDAPAADQCQLEIMPIRPRVQKDWLHPKAR